jgi:hypothetical protein
LFQTFLGDDIVGKYLALALTLCLSACDATVASPANQLAKQQGASPAPTVSASASATPSAAPASGTGTSAAALANPYAVGRVWVYDTTLSQSTAECTIEITGDTGTNYDLKVTNRYGRTVDAKNRSVSKTGDGGIPYPLATAIYNAKADFAKTTGSDRTTTQETLTIPAGTFETTKVTVKKPTNPVTLGITWVSEKYGVLKQEVRYGDETAAPLSSAVLKSLN